LSFSTLDKESALVKIGLMPVIQTGTNPRLEENVVLTSPIPDALGPHAVALLMAIQNCSTACAPLLMQRGGAHHVLGLAKAAHPELLGTLHCTGDCDALGQHGLWLANKLVNCACQILERSTQVEYGGC